MSETSVDRVVARRRRWIIALVALLVAVSAVVLFATRGGSGEDGEAMPVQSAGPTASGSQDEASPQEGDSSSSPASTASENVPQETSSSPEGGGEADVPADEDPTLEPTVIPTADPVALDEPAELASEVTARLTQISTVEGTAAGPGEVAGPAIRVVVEVTNETGASITMTGSAVNVYYGSDRIPALPLSGPDIEAFPTRIPAGESGLAALVFGVPEGERDEVVVEVNSADLSRVVLFEGSLA
ncbi:hypothetical protein [Serinibacter salmoneus]|uniref:DUF4352 domain-containing protein n=1 Tax=Serinibacter salmoneus TaxID=556530 RepID=A0A2A9D2J1_9MICO|nr:hypothetical protein [Serinibacter salmoneus]PFG20465.1 hypothetical protein ATL40_2065 [Serinibacter salmoneus]